ncbi:hypothetical protein M1589_03755 [Candidatus Marsarchaeota archaeon]|nr:hypothetical protein [Candidatus Marsarchaeota archaeon]MCL5115481.1 hypothetical protein [Candidatus Marsarchaeota archaeon]
MSAPKQVSAEGSVSIEGLDKAAVLAALYNGARAQGLGFLHYNPKPMTVEEAKGILEAQTNFDYLNGRVLKVDLSDKGGTACTSFNPWAYDRDNGEGAAAEAIQALRDGQTEKAPQILRRHVEGVIEASMLSLPEAKRRQLSRLADSNPEALEVCMRLMLQYALLDPETNPEGKTFFDGFNPERSAQAWYAEKEPFNLLEKAGIKGPEITKLFNEKFRGDVTRMYFSLALFMNPEVPDSYRKRNGLPPLRKE